MDNKILQHICRAKAAFQLLPPSGAQAVVYTRSLRMIKQSQLSISPVEESILIILDRHELYGLEIIEALENGSGGKVKVSFGTLYPALRRLERKGFVKTRWGDETPEERGGARRKYYRISSKGTEVLHEIRQIRADLTIWDPAYEQICTGLVMWKPAFRGAS